MDSLLTNRVDPALMRVLEKRSDERDNPPPRRRMPVSRKPEEEEEKAESQAHEIDDLA